MLNATCKCFTFIQAWIRASHTYKKVLFWYFKHAFFLTAGHAENSHDMGGSRLHTHMQGKAVRACAIIKLQFGKITVYKFILAFKLKGQQCW